MRQRSRQKKITLLACFTSALYKSTHTCFTSTKVQILTPGKATLQAMRETIISELQAPPELHQELVAACASVGIAASLTGTQVTCTCSTSTKVQILTPEARRQRMTRRALMPSRRCGRASGAAARRTLGAPATSATTPCIWLCCVSRFATSCVRP